MKNMNHIGVTIKDNMSLLLRADKIQTNKMQGLHKNISRLSKSKLEANLQISKYIKNANDQARQKCIWQILFY